MADTNPTSPGSSSNNAGGGAPKQGGLSWSMPPSSGAQPQAKPVSTVPGAMPASAKPAQPKPVSAPAAMKKNTADTPDSSRRLALIVGAVVVLVLLVGAWLTWGNGSTSGTATSTDQMMGSSTDSGTDMTGVPTTGSSTGGLTVVSPQSAGLSVAIAKINVPQPTWIVVYDSMNGAPGRALGATLFFPESNGNGGTVSLLRATTAGQTYFVGESVDSGDRVFSLHGDQQLVGSDGKPVWYSFTAQ